MELRNRKRNIQREIRLSSNPKENSIHELEKMIRQNQYMHHQYKPQLQSTESMKYLSFINKSTNKDHQDQHQEFIQGLDKKNQQSIVSDNVNLQSKANKHLASQERLTTEDQDSKIKLLSTVNSAVENFIKVKFLNKKVSEADKLDNFKRNFQNRLKNDPLNEIQKKIMDIKRGVEYSLDDIIYAHSIEREDSLSKLDKSSIGKESTGNFPDLTQSNQSLLYLPPVRQRVNQSTVSNNEDKQKELMRKLTDKLKSRTKVLHRKRFQSTVDGQRDEPFISNTSSPIHSQAFISKQERQWLSPALRRYSRNNLQFDSSSLVLPNQTLYQDESTTSIQNTLEELNDIDQELAQKLKDAGLNEFFESNTNKPQQSLIQLYKKIILQKRKKSILNVFDLTQMRQADWRVTMKSINKFRLSKIIKKCDQKIDTEQETQSLEKISIDQKHMCDAITKYRDIYDINDQKVEYNEILNDIKYDDKNTRDLAKESLKKYNEGFV
ncbi:UNKNOWN [Stylonychia lemnae]|uniref:Uncharacterized protein n=1 Tax=Stylonychia lemnae TaxID=5949 RepID=A0A078A3H7_STYLE|nr:UNKNOWN [Stylonychia lemnae]|eukprot:CDW76732.1 UNKNOWN [Stylonychia lemnae]